MRWPLSEYVLKGVFLGLLLYGALSAPDAAAAGRVGLWLVGGLGAGFLVAPTVSPKQATGLTGMRERAELLGGQFTLASALGQGTRIEVVIPLGDPAEGAEPPHRETESQSG